MPKPERRRRQGSKARRCSPQFGIKRVAFIGDQKGKARQGKASQAKARQGKARQGKARQGKARQGKASQAWIIALRRPACKLGRRRGRVGHLARTKQASLPRRMRYTPLMRLKNKTAVVIGAGQSPGE